MFIHKDGLFDMGVYKVSALLMWYYMLISEMVSDSDLELFLASYSLFTVFG